MVLSKKNDQRLVTGCLSIVGPSCLCLTVFLVAFFLNPIFFLDDIPRNYFVNATFPLIIKPEIEKIPGVKVIYISDGGYEDLTYVTLEINNTWTMSLNVSSNGNFIKEKRILIVKIGDCSLYDDSFDKLEDAITFYENDPEYQRCKNLSTPYIPRNP